MRKTGRNGNRGLWWLQRTWGMQGNKETKDVSLSEEKRKESIQHNVHTTYQNTEEIYSDNQETRAQSSNTDGHSNASDKLECSEKQMEALKRSKERWSLRQKNCHCRTTTKTLIDQDDYRLESSLKKCTALVRKLKSVSKDTKDSLLVEIQTLNLSMYISEICGAFFEAKFRIADVVAVAEVVSELYRRYPEFSDHFLEHLFRNIAQNSALDWNTKKSFLHLAVELCCVNVVPSFKLVAFLKETSKSSHVSSEVASALNAFASLAKSYSSELLLLPPRELCSSVSENDFKEDWEYWILSREEKKLVFGVYESLFEKSCNVLNELQKEMSDLEKEANVSRQMQGEVQQDTQNVFQNKRKQFQKLCTNIKTLCHLLGFQIPFIIIQDEERQNDPHSPNTLDSISGTISQDSETDKQRKSCFETEVERKFYEELPTLAVSQGQSDQQDVKVETQEDKQQSGESVASREQLRKSRQVDDILQLLSSCSDMEKVDKWCLDNWSDWKKSQTRKKLVKALFNLTFSNPELVPMAGRLVATLNPLYPDLASNVTQALKEDFMNYYEKKEIGEYLLKCRKWNARWIGEMTKFRLFPAHTVLSYVKLCLDDFSHYNVDILCILLETCGRFLYNNSETEYRTSSLLDILWRLKSVKNLEPRHEVMVENAYYTVRPLDSGQEKNLPREPLKEYIHHILFETRYQYRELPSLVKKLRKLPCTMEIESFLIDEFLQTENFPYDCLEDMAKVITEYSKYRDSIGIGVVDGIVEAIFCLLESQDNRFLQQRVAQLKLLGELFKTHFVNGMFIMNLAYFILSYGWTEAFFFEQENTLFTRIRMVCSLLETCGLELLDTVSLKRMETFFLHLLHTIWYSNKSKLTEDSWSLRVLSLLPIHLQHIVTEVAEMYAFSSLVSITLGQWSERWEQMVDKFCGVIPDLTIGSLQKNKTATPRSISNDGTSRSEDSFSNEDANCMRKDWSFSSYKETDEREEVIASEDEVGSSSTPRIEEETKAESFGEGELDNNPDTYSVNESESDSDDSEVEEEATDTSNNAPRKQQDLESFDQEVFAILTESLSEASQNRNAMNFSSSFRPLLSSARNVVNNTSSVVSMHDRDEQDEKVSFQVLMKKGGKPQVRYLHIPSDSSLVTASRAVDEMEKEEKEELKRLVLTSSTMQRKGRYRKR